MRCLEQPVRESDDWRIPARLGVAVLFQRNWESGGRRRIGMRNSEYEGSGRRRRALEQDKQMPCGAVRDRRERLGWGWRGMVNGRKQDASKTRARRESDDERGKREKQVWSGSQITTNNSSYCSALRLGALGGLHDKIVMRALLHQAQLAWVFCGGKLLPFAPSERIWIFSCVSLSGCVAVEGFWTCRNPLHGRESGFGRFHSWLAQQSVTIRFLQSWRIQHRWTRSWGAVQSLRMQGCVGRISRWPIREQIALVHPSHAHHGHHAWPPRSQ